jgi:hypothetical protein
VDLPQEPAERLVRRALANPIDSRPLGKIRAPRRNGVHHHLRRHPPLAVAGNLHSPAG